MPEAHLVDGKRTCGGITRSKGNTTVFVNNKLWAVDGDETDHNSGGLKASGGKEVYVEGKKVVVKGDPANPDERGHQNPAAADGSGDVSAG